jgi:SAM-dependent methyltransferase
VDDDFAAVDAGDATRLVAMMHATDAWPAVQAAREWVLGRVAPPPDTIVLDVGCGPGTFGIRAATRGAVAVDVDRSRAMLDAARAAHPAALVIGGDVAGLPLRDGAAALTHVERVLQWTTDPGNALAELARVTAPGGRLAVTDTDWSAFRMDHDEPRIADRWSAAALGWVPHARLAATLPERLRALGCDDVEVRHDRVTITAWNPDDPAHADGPPGLPLRSIGAGAAEPERARLLDDVAVLAGRARAGRFRADLVLVTAVGRVDAR